MIFVLLRGFFCFCFLAASMAYTSSQASDRTSETMLYPYPAVPQQELPDILWMPGGGFLKILGK